MKEAKRLTPEQLAQIRLRATLNPYYVAPESAQRDRNDLLLHIECLDDELQALRQGYAQSIEARTNRPAKCDM